MNQQRTSSEFQHIFMREFQFSSNRNLILMAPTQSSSLSLHFKCQVSIYSQSFFVTSPLLQKVTVEASCLSNLIYACHRNYCIKLLRSNTLELCCYSCKETLFVCTFNLTIFKLLDHRIFITERKRPRYIFCFISSLLVFLSFGKY